MSEQTKLHDGTPVPERWAELYRGILIGAADNGGEFCSDEESDEHTLIVELSRAEAENAALKSAIASLLSIDDSKVSEYVVLDAKALKQAAGNRVAELEAQVQRPEAPVSDQSIIINSLLLRLGNVLVDMTPEWDDSITGFNAAMDIVRDVLTNPIRLASRSTPPAQPVDAQKGKPS